jgi:hypothetical protein
MAGLPERLPPSPKLRADTAEGFARTKQRINLFIERYCGDRLKYEKNIRIGAGTKLVLPYCSNKAEKAILEEIKEKFKVLSKHPPVYG